MRSVSGEPQTATFLVADLAGYTALTEAHGDAQAADVAAAFFDEVRSVMADYGAQEVNTAGDAIIVRAPDAGNAIHLAARILGDFAQRDRTLGVRIGMHTGTAVSRGGDWFGSAVNMASRIADLAQTGEALLSTATRQAAADAVDESQLRPRGRTELKNVHDPVELLVLVPAGQDEVRPLPIDPVCRMSVDPRRCAATRVFAGVEYHFCSVACAEAFTTEPARYAGRSSSSALVLVSDDARERAARRLGRAYTRGRIEEAELEQRVAAVWSARTRADLHGVTHDLPRRRARPISPWLLPIAPLVLLTRMLRARLRRRRPYQGDGR